MKTQSHIPPPVLVPPPIKVNSWSWPGENASLFQMDCLRDNRGLQTQGRKKYHFVKNQYHFVKNQFYTFFQAWRKNKAHVMEVNSQRISKREFTSHYL